MAWSASALAVLARVSGTASCQAVYSACRASNSATASRPALGSGAFVLGPAIPDDRRGLISLVPGAVAGLPPGIAEGVLALWLVSSRHDASPSRNGSELVGRGGVCVGFGRPAASARERLRGPGVSGMASQLQQVEVLAQPVACPFDLHDDGMVEQPVEQRGGDNGVPEHLAPFCEATV
jgi:hypothetical protein